MANNKKVIYPLQHWFRSRVEDMGREQIVKNELFMSKLNVKKANKKCLDTIWYLQKAIK